MLGGESLPTHQTNHDQKANNSADSREEKFGEVLAQLNDTFFEGILKDCAASKKVLKEDPNEGIRYIMGLIEDAKERERPRAETQFHNTTRIKDSVKFDDDFDFIDDGEEEVLIDKPPVVAVEKMMPNIKSSICGNPVTDYDNIDIDFEAMYDTYEISRMEKGEKQEIPADSQINVNCNEEEQRYWLNKKGIDEFSSNADILGPASKGEFASFNQSSTPLVACELGVMNPITGSNFNEIKHLTANGRLVPAIPRRCFSGYQQPTAPGNLSRMSSISKAPVTIMMKAAVPSLLTAITDSQIPNLYSPSRTLPVSVAEADGVQKQTASQKKRIKNKAKKSANADSDEVNSVNEDSDKAQKEINDEEKENKEEEEETEEEIEARRLKNRKGREKKKAKKEKEKKDLEKIQNEQMQKENTSPLEHSRGTSNTKNSSALASAQQGDQQKDHQIANNNRRSVGSGTGGKNKKNTKNVRSEYEFSGPDSNLDDILKELGINDVSELTENPGKKNKNKAGNGNNNNNNNSKKKSQASQKKELKEVAPPSENENISKDEGVDKNKKKGGKTMDEVALAASITKRHSSGVGQQSEEDDDQSYVSAQENLGSNSRLSTPPAEFVDARQSRDEDSIMADPNNYLDDDKVALVAKQLDEEFITVGKNNKKNKKPNPQIGNVSTSSASSSSSPPTANRRNNATDSHVPSNNVTSSGNQSNHHHQRSNNRPVAHPTTLGDFMESTKKDTHKNIKHRKIGGSTSTASQKNNNSLEDPALGTPGLSDATETPISINTAPAFSYADAAKKTSGENTPAHEMSPVPPSAVSTVSTGKSPQSSSVPKSNTPPSEKKKKSVVLPEEVSPTVANNFSASASGAVQLPPSTAGVAASDISFGYEETPEDKLKRQQKEANSATSPQSEQTIGGMNGKQFFGKFKLEADKQAPMPQNGLREEAIYNFDIRQSWIARWNEFSSNDPKPVTFKPSLRR